MKFCDRCGSLMRIEKKIKRAFLVCPKCGMKKIARGKLVISERLPSKVEVVVVRRKEEELPKTQVLCPKCNYEKAYWWMQQTRAADEPPTLFYRCIKCGHSWRSYG